MKRRELFSPIGRIGNYKTGFIPAVLKYSTYLFLLEWRKERNEWSNSTKLKRKRWKREQTQGKAKKGNLNQKWNPEKPEKNVTGNVNERPIKVTNCLLVPPSEGQHQGGCILKRKGSLNTCRTNRYLKSRMLMRLNSPLYLWEWWKLSSGDIHRHSPPQQSIWGPAYPEDDWGYFIVYMHYYRGDLIATLQEMRAIQSSVVHCHRSWTFASFYDAVWFGLEPKHPSINKDVLQCVFLSRKCPFN